MKRILVALLLAISLLIGQGDALASEHFGELNIKEGANFCEDCKLKQNGKVNDFTKPNAGVSFAAEYLINADHLIS
jgi:hypothetical protein